MREQLRADMRAALEQQRRLHEEQLEGVKAGMRAAHEEEMRQERGAGEARLAEAEAQHRQQAETQRRSAEAAAAQGTAARQEAEAALRAAADREAARLKQVRLLDTQVLRRVLPPCGLCRARTQTFAGKWPLAVATACTLLPHTTSAKLFAVWYRCLFKVHEQAVAALVSRHTAELATAHSQAELRTSELQAAVASLERSKTSLEAEVQVRSQPSL